MADFNVEFQTDNSSFDIEFESAEYITVKDHSLLDNRDADDQHPISAITGLQTALDAKVSVSVQGETLIFK